MARQRQHLKDGRGSGGRKPPGLRIPRTKHPNLNNNDQRNNKVAMFVALNIVIVVLSAVYLYYAHSLEVLVTTPAQLPQVVTKSGLDVPDMFWGTYRPGCYFGMRTRSPQTIATGMMWFTQKIKSNEQAIDIRHWCNQWDSVKRYGWQQHDGEKFGAQRIEDDDYVLLTSFIKHVGGKHGGDYTARITVKPKHPDRPSKVPVSLLFYVWGTPDSVFTTSVENEGHLRKIHGSSESLGNFTLQLRETENSETILKYNYLVTETPNMAHLKETVLRHMVPYQSKGRTNVQIYGLLGDTSQYYKMKDNSYKSNFVVYQATFVPTFELEIYFKSRSFSDRPHQMVGDLYAEELVKQMNSFEKRFESTFKLAEKGFPTDDIKAAWAGLSNMLGGLGYFYGASLVQSSHNKEPVNYWNAPLFASVPSRSFFPRGFLWDEGFHNLLILEWNSETSKDIIGHWLDLMNIEGWIPREQILGPEARERVPSEFVIQKNTIGNPPTLFLAIERLLFKMKNGVISKDTGFFKRILPRLKVWFDWFEVSQAGMLAGTYRWRGRDAKTDLELNPKTLSSGLDDFPRATHPTVDERHLDLRCWMAFASGVLSDIGEFIGQPLDKVRDMHKILMDNDNLDKLHWSEESQSYSDYGYHSSDVILVKKAPPPGSQEQFQVVTRRVVRKEPNLRFVDNFGYISLFPFLLKIVNPDNPKLGKILTDLRKEHLLYTAFGLRSLAKTSPFYGEYNTEHDPPYWRGSIWINMNFLAIRSLKHYGTVEGPYRDQAKELYIDLRHKVMKNIIEQYKISGHIWEQYNDTDGTGKGVHPFNGWSSLFVLLMAEIY